MPVQLLWMVSWNSSGLLIKRNKQMYSMKLNNPEASYSYYNVLIHHKTVGMQLAEGKGVVVVTNQRSGQ
ncbi:60S ribosomal protein L28 [Galemys pyrenaicus]|uniref:60S ribosomal protein L28 n=1 Tax=Galemys pyrenaicus TaxID=202257 RepID=A0A8J6A401_GALPY|nr:60S ribosomal protein L28 [Galemys pyrenaicus]